MENRRLRSLLTLAGLFWSTFGFSQTDAGFLNDTFFRDGKYYVAVAIIAIVFAVVITYLVILDRKISNLEKELNNEN